jgi:hypothetical protein
MNFAFISTLNRSEQPAWMEFLYADGAILELLPASS